MYKKYLSLARARKLSVLPNSLDIFDIQQLYLRILYINNCQEHSWSCSPDFLGLETFVNMTTSNQLEVLLLSQLEVVFLQCLLNFGR